MEVTKPYEFIGLGAMDVTKPYEFIGFGAMYLGSRDERFHFDKGLPTWPGGTSPELPSNG